MIRKLLNVLLITLIILGLGTGTALASNQQQEGPLQLTLNEAIARALACSEAVEKAELDIDRAEKEHVDAEKMVEFIPSGIGPYTPEVEAAYTNLITTDLKWRMAKRALSAAEDKVVLDTCNKYWAVQRAQKNVAVKQAALEKARADWLKAKLSFEIGIINQEALLGAQTRYEAAKGALQSAKNDLAKAYVAFNNLIGIQAERRPVLSERVSFSPLEVNDVHNAVQRIIDRDPQIWQAERRVSILKKVRYLYDNWDVADIDMQKAALDVESLEESMYLLGRSLYYAIRNVEASYPAAEQAVRMAEESYRVAQLKYEVGLATKTDVADAKAKLLDAQKSLYDLITQHAYLKLAFQKPWAYAGGGSVAVGSGGGNASAGSI